MTPKQYQKRALRTEKTPLFVKDANGEWWCGSRVLHACMGVCTEAGELMDIMKKVLIYKFANPGGLDVDHVVEEVGDCLWYLTLVMDSLGFSSLQPAMEANIRKLETRYPGGFTPKKALKRNLKKEKRALKGGKK